MKNLDLQAAFERERVSGQANAVPKSCFDEYDPDKTRLALGVRLGQRRRVEEAVRTAAFLGYCSVEIRWTGAWWHYRRKMLVEVRGEARWRTSVLREIMERVG